MKFIFQVLLILFFSLIICSNSFSQKFMTKTGHAYFMSHTDAIDIDGNNHQVAAIANIETGDIVVIVLIKAFEFTLATADKHFNETYMESDEFPKAIFKGKIALLKDIDLSKNAEYIAVADGNLTIHGETRAIKQEGTIQVKDGKIHIDCDFNVLIANYKIKVPKSVEGRVAQVVNVKIDLSLTSKWSGNEN